MKIIIDEVLKLKPEQSKTNVILNFELDKNYSQLEIDCSYTPKEVSDMSLAKHDIEEAIEKFIPSHARPANMTWENFLPLVNLVTFSLDFEDKYIGCAHRHDPVQKHIISESFSSRGLCKHKPVAGKYRVVISVHSVTTEFVDYHLVIKAKEE